MFATSSNSLLRWLPGFSRRSPRACSTKALRVQVVETSLGLGVDHDLLRHLALRFGSDTDELKVENADFTEAHFGPGSGSFKEGFLNCGKGMVADSEYLELSEAGFTKRSVEECLKWCENWADGRLYVTVGQNCWSMVSQFLEEDPDLHIPESVKFKEDQINGWTELFVNAAQEKADKDGVEIGEVWDRVMKDPSALIPELVKAISPDALSKLIPENMRKIADNADQAKEAVIAQMSTGEDDGLLQNATDKVLMGFAAAAENVSEFAMAKASELSSSAEE